jgi:hypothetical protein
MEDDTIKEKLNDLKADITEIKGTLSNIVALQIKLVVFEKDLEAHSRDIGFLKEGLHEEKVHGKALADRVLALEKAPAEKVAGGVSKIAWQAVGIIVAALCGGIIAYFVKG